MLSADQLDAVTELINIGLGRAAASLNELVAAHVNLSVPTVRVLPAAEIDAPLGEIGDGVLSSVQLNFHGALNGSAMLVFPPASAAQLVAVMAGEDVAVENLDSIRAGTLNEVGNILINGVMGVISNILEQRLRFSLPRYMEERIRAILDFREIQGEDTVLLARTRFRIEEYEIEGNILLVFEVDSFEAFLQAIKTNWTANAGIVG